MGGAYASYRVYVDWDLSGSFTDDPDKDISEFVKQFSVTRGFKAGTGMAEVGKFACTLNNADLRFSPGLHSEIKPRRPLLVQGVYGGNNYTLFRGYICSPRPSPLFSKEAFMDGVDANDTLTRTEVTLPSAGGVAQGSLVSDLVALVVEAVYPDVFFWTPDGALSPVDYWWCRNVTGAQAIEDLVTSEQGWFYFSNTGIPRFCNRHYRILNTAASGTISNAMSGITYDPGDDAIYNDVRVQVHPRVQLDQEEIWRYRESPAAIASWETLSVDTAYSAPALSVVTPTVGLGSVRQEETATIVGVITLAGYAIITVTAAGMTNSPKNVSVSVALNDTAEQVAAKAYTALILDSDVSAFFDVSQSAADLIFTAKAAADNDATMNVASANYTCTGLTDQPTSANTTAGRADADIVVNTLPDGSGTADMTGSLIVTYTDSGEGGHLTVQNTSAQTLFLTQCRVRGNPLIAPDVAELKASDSTSQTDYCKRTLNIDLPWQQDSLFAADLANATVLEHAEPPAGGEIAVTICNKNAALLGLMLNLDLNSVVYVEESNTGVAGAYFVAGITHQVSQGLMFHEVTYRLEKGSGYSDWFVLDASLLDTGRLGY
jgi:hypothetical protein